MKPWRVSKNSVLAERFPRLRRQECQYRPGQSRLNVAGRFCEDPMKAGRLVKSVTGLGRRQLEDLMMLLTCSLQLSLSSKVILRSLVDYPTWKGLRPDPNDKLYWFQ